MIARKTNSDAAATAVRRFFHEREFLETLTPSIVPAPIPEPSIEAFAVAEGFLRTSPEPQMKILMAEGAEKIFQIGSCFRKNEKGRFHAEEFTMLEWYEKGADYHQLIAFTRDLLSFVAQNTINSTIISRNGVDVDLATQWDVLTVSDAFAKFADTNSEDAVAENRFEEILVESVEPALPNTPVILTDYPAELAALAKIRTDSPPVAERWELYVGGVELANTYTELTDYEEHKTRFAKFAAERAALEMTKYPEDPDFMRALRKGLPDCAGCALGMDRLVMLLNNDESIAQT
jgi:lysyl-tRNA synthetase class 2